MYFQIRKIVLWPRIDAPPRVLEFKPGIVNVISGASKRGKSAVIPIIDYCLGAEKCAIPVGVIRENCAWFGLVVETVEGQKLLARREPGDQQSTGDMVLIEAPEVDVQPRIADKNTNVDVVKATLNRLAGLTNLEFEPGAESGYKSRPSFRDLMAFTFQPQNIVANPDVMFFKADTTEHREKLKTIFPYVLGAVTAEVLQARFELDRLNRLLRRKETELRGIDAATSAWQTEAQGWLRQAIELGLLSSEQVIPTDWPSIIDLMRQLAARHSRNARPSLAGIDVGLARLEVLRRDETQAAAKLTEHRQRMNELRRLRESSDAYSGSMHIQRDRLALSNWLRSLVEADASDPIVKLGQGGRDDLLTLCNNLEAVEVKLRTHPTVSETLDRETLRQRASAENVLTQLNEIRTEVASLERASVAAHAAANHFDRTERFLGRLEQAIQLYDRADQSSALRDEIARLSTEIAQLQRRISEAEIRRKLANALAIVQNAANQFVPQLDAEWPDAPIELIVDELTIKVIQGTRSDYLWEIGSGANWLAYHVATTLALQKFFLSEPNHHVPGLLVYDQPSQVYFPKRLAHEDTDEPVALRDQDVQAVRKVFALLGKEVRAAKGRLQIIVLDHAGEDVWGSLDGVELVPPEWFTNQSLRQ
jgi:hypothetical protein